MATIALAAVAAGGQIAGSTMSALGQLESGKAEASARIAQAVEELNAAKAQVYSNKQAMEELISSQIARGGGEVSGSLAVLVGDTAFKTAFENELIMRNAKYRAQVAAIGAQNVKQAAKYQAAGTLITGAVSAATSIAGAVTTPAGGGGGGGASTPMGDAYAYGDVGVA